ncbi:hypothetical protein DICSQDRAFT_144783 [Dichomitus squalens LYAD-421 SS1]|uniref:uncharacterized protein n=1 Tax=Dichomitus squalens (strain LYAD-421) TaxID=732165 RepID=UPI0004411900|nr:uncharacterized protein DICSQDRAFT_144783 [Dichomitus squalens LYAD-421 SS1]EJF64087.1 hypothetical protein DICSQDRAFT_144783 [Dichomitus squalens LYAD-421 SS1]
MVFEVCRALRKDATAIPVEILDVIVTSLLSHNRRFCAIANISLVSSRLRLIAFRRYFETLEVRSPRHWDKSCRILGMFNWVRKMRVAASDVQSNMDALSSFGSLRSLEIDFSSDGLSTQKTRCSLLFKSLTADLTVLKLTSLPRIDTALLSLVASRFPSLTTLELSSTERLDKECCWLCFEESSSCTIHSPVPDVFPSIEVLANAYGRALQPLENLEYLFLGVFLSDADVLSCHFDRCASVVISSPRTGFYSSPPFGPDKCVICTAEHGAAVHERERLASGIVEKILPSLKTVGWSSHFSEHGSGADRRTKTTIFCTRTLEVKVDSTR